MGSIKHDLIEKRLVAKKCLTGCKEATGQKH